MGCDGLRGGRGWRLDGLMGKVGRDEGGGEGGMRRSAMDEEEGVWVKDEEGYWVENGGEAVGKAGEVLRDVEKMRGHLQHQLEVQQVLQGLGAWRTIQRTSPDYFPQRHLPSTQSHP